MERVGVDSPGFRKQSITFVARLCSLLVMRASGGGDQLSVFIVNSTDYNDFVDRLRVLNLP